MIKKYFAVLLIILGLAQITYSQLITADPAFPTDQDAVVITFNASLGSGGLAGFTGDVYAHTGLITENSGSGSDWKYVKAGWSENIPACKMTNIGGDLWTLDIGPTIRQYYGIPDGEKIEQLAFVFRSADGSKTGKTESGGDIFYDVSEGNNVQIQISLPETRPLIVQLNDNIHVEGSTSNADSVYLYNDNQLVYSGTDVNFQYDFTVTSSGSKEFKAIAKSGSASAEDSFNYYVRPEVVVEALPDGVVDGINYINDNTVILCLYAPEKQYVFAIGDFSNWDVNDDNYMKQTPDGNRWWVELSGLEAGKEYVYQYFIDGNIRVGDPYADKVSDPWNDSFISNITYPNLIQYPQGKTTGIATVFQTAQQPFNWQLNDFNAPDKEKLVIYELLLRDFLAGHTFDELIDTLGYFKKLGINAIELMPVSEFEGNNSWGYNPNYYFAVDKYYGPKNTFKKFIDEAHKKGIAVIMDMVLNHAYGTNTMAMMYWDAENNRPAANNPWFNVTSPNPVFNWGSDFNHESQATQDFVDRVNKYWLEEYNVDGFRFDFTKGFTNTPGDGSGYDASRIAILKRMNAKIKEVKSDAYVILEHFAANSEEKVLSDDGMMIWGNINYNYNEATMGWNDNSNFSWVSYEQRGWNDPNLVGYMESHDEERLMYKNIEYGNSSGSYNIKELNTALERNAMAATFFIPVPGPKMIWQFGELGYDYSINTCEDGSVDESCRVAPKPIRWDYYENVNRFKVFKVYQGLIHLKETEAAFSTSDYSLSVSGAMKSIHLNNNDMDVTIIGNFDVNAGNINPAFQNTGWWYDYFSGDSVNIINVNDQINLEAGEYHLYTSKRLSNPIYLGVNEAKKTDNLGIEIFPNPAKNYVKINSIHNNQISEIQVYTLDGKIIYHSEESAKQVLLDSSGWRKGMYILKAKLNNSIYSGKLIIN